MTKIPESLPGRAGYEISQESRFDVERLSGLFAPWDSDAEVSRLAELHGVKADAASIAAARLLQSRTHVSQAELRERDAGLPARTPYVVTERSRFEEGDE